MEKWLAIVNTKDPQTYAIIGAAMEVHRQLGHGFLEAVYQEAFAIEMAEQGIPFLHEAELVISYKGTPLSCEYRADFLCYESVVVELKAVAQVASSHHAQVINELKATGYRVGLLLNFGAPSLEQQRFIRSNQRDAPADFLAASHLREDDAIYYFNSPPPSSSEPPKNLRNLRTT